MTRRWQRALLLAAGLALLASACGGGEDAGGEDHWIVGLLQRIPAAAPGTNQVSVVDLRGRGRGGRDHRPARGGCGRRARLLPPRPAS